MAKKPTTHPYAHLAGTYQDSTGNLFRVALTGADALTQQRQRTGQEWEEPYSQLPAYVQRLLDFKLFTKQS